MVVGTGLVLARGGLGTDSPPVVTGAVVDNCDALLPFVEPDEIWVDDTTQSRTGAEVHYERARISSLAWSVAGVRSRRRATGRVPLIGRDQEWQALLGVLEGFLRDRKPEIVTVCGGPGMGKRRLLAEFERMARSRCTDPGAPPIVNLPAVLDAMALSSAICECCGITTDDLPDTARTKLRTVVRRTAATVWEAEHIISVLQPLLHRTADQDLPTYGAETSAAWWLLLERITSHRGAVLIVHDLELADQDVVDFVDHITRPASGRPVLVAAATRSSVPSRLPSQVAIQRRAITLTLLPLPDSDVEALLDRLLDAGRVFPRRATAARRCKEVFTRLRRKLVSVCDGSPALAHEYAALLRDAVRRAPRVVPAEGGRAHPAQLATGLLPPAIERMTAERLDRLPDGTRAILRDAAVAGAAAWGDVVAAAGSHDRDEVVPHLDRLVHQNFLARMETDPVSGDSRYEFRLPSDCHVAYSQLSLPARAEKQANVVGWFHRRADAADHRVAPLLDHYRRGLRDLTTSAGLSFDGPPSPELFVLESGGVTEGAGRGQVGDVVRYYQQLARTPLWCFRELCQLVDELRALADGSDPAGITPSEWRAG